MYKNQAQIGWGSFQSNETVTNYTPFIINLYYENNMVPDSGQINIQSSVHRPLGNSKLYVDNLNFDGFLSGIKDPPLPAAGKGDFNIYPNPFSEQASVSFTLNREERILLRLFDFSGKQEAVLVNENYAAGKYTIDLPASGLSAGFYICVMSTGEKTFSRKIVIY